ncbi:MAG: BspA family leucine-rich repeat surface protein, partial [Erysipelotrichaceae bacterium]|nr:BspA family leucine-rich repeat surface protein [Erysipelotrichaceae bacterium]
MVVLEEGTSLETAETPVAEDSEPVVEVPATDTSTEQPAAEEPVTDETDVEYAEEAVYTVAENDLKAVALYGEAALNQETAALALQNNTELDDAEIADITASLFAASRKIEPVADIPREGDGVTIEDISIFWVTEDTVDNGDESLLYVKLEDDSLFDVRLQINYSLSGARDYEPGTIMITIPGSLVNNRDGNPTGVTILPYPDAPSKKNDFNVSYIDGNYVITNTKRINSAAKGYIQVAFDQLRPHELVDMQVTDVYNAYIEVITPNKMTLGLISNEINAQFDTNANIFSAQKRAYPSVERVLPEAIPEEYRDPNEEWYVLVSWYVWGSISANTLYQLDLIDTIDGEYGGFIIDATSADGLEQVRNTVDESYKSKSTGYYYVTTAYPGSKFTPDTDYTFHNHIKMRLREVDDENAVTYAEADGTIDWRYTDPKWIEPTGHFMITKNGNDGKAKNNITRNPKYDGGKEYDDNHIWFYRQGRSSDGSSLINGWYGFYPSAINDLQDEYADNGENGGVELSYTIDTVGYVMPWMYDKLSHNEEDELAPRIIKNYYHPVRIITEDTGVSIGRYGDKLKTGKDYDFVSVEVPDTVWVYKGTPQNINPDGTFHAETFYDGTFKYERDYDKSHNPDIAVEILRNGQWEQYAVVSWPSGTYTVTFADGRTQKDKVIALPENVENVRTVVVCQNTNTEDCVLQAAIDYDIRIVINLHSTEEIIALIEEEFEKTNTPELYIYNGTVEIPEEYVSEGVYKEIGRIEKDGYDTIRGYTTDTMVVPEKTAEQKVGEVDYENRQIIIHYTGKVEERSVINDRVTYEQAINDERLVAETHGYWYDLLPKDVQLHPDRSRIILRENDNLLNVFTYENYKGSGRTLVVFEVELSPTPERYQNGNMYYYEDVPTITFDAIYDFDSYINNPKRIHNVIAFESSNDFMGTIEKYMSEPDDPNANNNVYTKQAFENDTEKGYMTGLDPNREGAPFVYAGVYTNLDVLGAGRVSLHKDVQVNNDGVWSQGTWEESPELSPEENQKEREDNERIVFEGGQYSYRLVMMPSRDTQSKDMIIFDSLEDYEARKGMSYDIDVWSQSEHGTWQGTFAGLDLEDLTEKGCKPVVYYRTENIQLSNEDDPTHGIAMNMDVHDESVWTEESKFTESLDKVKAIAIDCSKTADGKDFMLEPMEVVVVIIKMNAPAEGEVDDYEAYAYNNAYYLGTTININTGESESDSFIRSDYTKVGLINHEFHVIKKWIDDKDRDGIRPDEITVHLLADGKDTGKTLVLNEKSEWKGSFFNLPYTDEEGNRIHYSVLEDEVAGYTASYEPSAEDATIKNTHEPERITINGVKTWELDEEENRPESIRVRLYKVVEDGDDVLIATKTVKASDGWKYSFTNLFKNEDGEEIKYRVEEVVMTTGKGASYSQEVDGYNIKNIYHPKGDLLVKKYVDNVTAVSAEKEFTFTFSFSDNRGEQPVPVRGPFSYVILDKEGNEVGNGTVEDTGKVKIKGGQSILVKDIDEYITYAVTEEDLAGFALISSSNTTGIIKPNQTVTANFTNRYDANGKLNLEAWKKLEGKEMEYHQFKFELSELVDNPEGYIDINLISTVTSGVPETVYKEDGSIDYSIARVIFNAISYELKDVGKTFRYVAREVNEKEPGYIYTNTVYGIEVTVIDNGDGTLGYQIHYYDATTPEVVEADLMEFINRYDASGEVVLRAWKDMRGRTLKDGDFTFELYDVNNPEEPIDIKKNTSDAAVFFDPIEYKFEDAGKKFRYFVKEVVTDDETIIFDDRVFGYEVEVVDNDHGVLDTNVTYYIIDPVNNAWTTSEDLMPVFVNELKPGNLTIEKEIKNPEDLESDADITFRFTIMFVDGNIKDEDITEYTLYEGDNETVVPVKMIDKTVIINLKDGQKAEFNNIPAGVSYQVTEETIKDWVVYESENISGKIEPLTTLAVKYVNEYAPGTTAAQFYGVKLMDETAADKDAFEFVLYDDENNVLQTVKNLAGGFIMFEPIVYKEEGVYHYVVKENNTNDPNIQYDEHEEKITVTVKKNDDESLSANVEYDSDGIKFVNRTNPGSLRIKKFGENVTENNKNDKFRFKVTLTNSKGLPLSDDENIYWYVIDANGNVVPQTAAKTPAMLRKTRLSLITETEPNAVIVPVSGNIENKVTVKKDHMQNISPVVRNVDLSGYPSSGATVSETGETGTNIKWTLYSDGTLVVEPKEGTSGTLTPGEQGSIIKWTTNEGNTISYDSINRIKFKETIVMNADQSYLFGTTATNDNVYPNRLSPALQNVQAIDLTGLDASALTNVKGMFRGCEKLTELDLTPFSGAKLENMSSMFYRCRQLAAVDLSMLDTSAVTDMSYLFYICSVLNDINMNGIDTSNVTNMSHMFQSCVGLEYFDFSVLNTSNVQDMSYMLNAVQKMKTIDLSSFDTSKVRNMSHMFTNDRFTSLNTDGWDTSKVTNMSYMFAECSNCTSIDLSNINTVSVGDMSYMFYRVWDLTSIDVSGFDTRNVRNMFAMFMDCGNLTSLDLSNFNTSNVKMMGRMFSGCRSIVSLDLSNFDTSNVGTYGNYGGVNYNGRGAMNEMFAYCYSLESLDISNFDMRTAVGTSSSHGNSSGVYYIFASDKNLRRLVIGEHFNLGGRTDGGYNNWASVPSAPTKYPFTGKWIMEDRSYGPFTGDYLSRKDFDAAKYQGVWIWEINSDVCNIRFDANGGSTTEEDLNITNATASITMPDDSKTTRKHYILTSWNTKPDGTGDKYDLGEEVNGLVRLGYQITLYAQWTPSNLREYKVTHYTQNLSGAYILRESETFIADKGTTVTPDPKTYEGYYVPEKKSGVVLDDDSLVIRYDYDLTSYEIIFDGNGATSGNMANQQMFVIGNDKLSVNKYQRTGYMFTGWNTKTDGTGEAFVDEQMVRGLAGADEKITLYAQWLNNDNQTTPSHSVIYVECKAGETIVIPELPDGTQYTIEKIALPEAWVKVEERNVSGKIVSNEISEATVMNRYEANVEVPLIVHKILEHGELADGEFSFELRNSRMLFPLTARNDSVDTNEFIMDEDGKQIPNPWYGTAAAIFELQFSAADLLGTNIIGGTPGTYEYFISEVNDGRSDVNYDGHSIRVVVTLTDAGHGVINVDVQYEGEVLFINEMKPTNLKITKETVNSPNDDETFEFILEVTDFNGDPITDSFIASISATGKDDEPMPKPFEPIIGPVKPRPDLDDKEEKVEINVTPGVPFELKGGETITVYGLPNGASYRVVETSEKENWILTSVTDDTGTLQTGVVSEAVFVNTFEREPEEVPVIIEATKRMQGGLINTTIEYTFELQDGYGEVLQTAGTDEAEVTESKITFEEIVYTLDDVGKTFRYYILEKAGSVPGVEFDKNIYIAE